MNKQNYIKPKAISVFSGLLYLNDDFEGGEFIFADYKRHIQVKKKFNLQFEYCIFTIYNIYIYIHHKTVSFTNKVLSVIYSRVI